MDRQAELPRRSARTTEGIHGPRRRDRERGRLATAERAPDALDDRRRPAVPSRNTQPSALTSTALRASTTMPNRTGRGQPVGEASVAPSATQPTGSLPAYLAKHCTTPAGCWISGAAAACWAWLGGRRCRRWRRGRCGGPRVFNGPGVWWTAGRRSSKQRLRAGPGTVRLQNRGSTIPAYASMPTKVGWVITGGVICLRCVCRPRTPDLLGPGDLVDGLHEHRQDRLTLAR